MNDNLKRVELEKNYWRWWEKQTVKTHWFCHDAPVYSDLEKHDGQYFVRQGSGGGWIPARFVKVTK